MAMMHIHEADIPGQVERLLDSGFKRTPGNNFLRKEPRGWLAAYFEEDEGMHFYHVAVIDRKKDLPPNF